MTWPTTPVENVASPQKFEVKYEGQPDTEEAEAFRMRRNTEIQNWLEFKAQFANAQQLERDSRAKVTATLFAVPKKGTQRYDIGGGYKVKLVHGLTYSLGNKDFIDDAGLKVPVRAQVEALEQAIIDKHGEVGAQILKQLITWTPELSGSAYEKIDATNNVEVDIRSMIDELLTIKPASPQLTFEEPKNAT